jgi:uncharacterized membrane protein YbaN (DUF454 family)
MNKSAHAVTALNCPSDLCAFSEFHCSPLEWSHGGVVGLRLVGTLAVGLGLVGVVLPLLPTTPFVLVAAWAFARSSPRLDAWLRAHPSLGPPLEAWEKRRAIPRRAKAIAVVTMPTSWIMLWAAGAPMGIMIGGGAVMLAVGGWILSRPS